MNSDKEVRNEEILWEWMQGFLGEIGDRNVRLIQHLQSGVLLCRLANKVLPNIIFKINLRPMTVFYYSNIESFLSTMHAFGLNKDKMFQANDVVEMKNAEKVYNDLLQFATVVCKLPTYVGPPISLIPKPKSAQYVAVEPDTSLLPNLDEKKILRQENSLIEWVNEMFCKEKGPVVVNSLSELNTGVIFIKLIQILTGIQYSSSSSTVVENPTTALEMETNLNIAFNLMFSYNYVPVTCCKSVDISSGSLEAIVNFVRYIRDTLDLKYIYEKKLEKMKDWDGSDSNTTVTPQRIFQESQQANKRKSAGSVNRSRMIRDDQSWIKNIPSDPISILNRKSGSDRPQATDPAVSPLRKSSDHAIATTPPQSAQHSPIPQLPSSQSLKKSVFKFDLPDNKTKSVLFNAESTTFREEVAKICSSRDWPIENVFVRDSDGKTLNLDTLLRDAGTSAQIGLKLSASNEQNVFKFCLPDSKTKSVLLSSDSTVTLRDEVTKISISRDWTMDNLLVHDTEGKPVDLETMLRDVPGASVQIVLKQSVFTFLLPDSMSKSVLMQNDSTTTIRDVVAKICLSRDWTMDNVLVQGNDGKPVDMNLMLRDAPETSVQILLKLSASSDQVPSGSPLSTRVHSRSSSNSKFSITDATMAAAKEVREKKMRRFSQDRDDSAAAAGKKHSGEVVRRKSSRLIKRGSDKRVESKDHAQHSPPLLQHDDPDLSRTDSDKQSSGASNENTNVASSTVAKDDANALADALILMNEAMTDDSGAQNIFRFILPDSKTKSIMFHDETTTIRDEIVKICNTRDWDMEEIHVLDGENAEINLDTPLANVHGLLVHLKIVKFLDDTPEYKYKPKSRNFKRMVSEKLIPNSKEDLFTVAEEERFQNSDFTFLCDETGKVLSGEKLNSYQLIQFEKHYKKMMRRNAKERLRTTNSISDLVSELEQISAPKSKLNRSGKLKKPGQEFIDSSAPVFTKSDMAQIEMRKHILTNFINSERAFITRLCILLKVVESRELSSLIDGRSSSFLGLFHSCLLDIRNVSKLHLELIKEVRMKLDYDPAALLGFSFCPGLLAPYVHYVDLYQRLNYRWQEEEEKRRVRSASTSGIAKRVFKFELPENKSKCIVLPDANPDQAQAASEPHVTIDATSTHADAPLLTIPTLRDEFCKLCETRSWDSTHYRLSDLNEEELDWGVLLTDVLEYTVSVVDKKIPPKPRVYGRELGHDLVWSLELEMPIDRLWRYLTFFQDILKFTSKKSADNQLVCSIITHIYEVVICYDREMNHQKKQAVETFVEHIRNESYKSILNRHVSVLELPFTINILAGAYKKFETSGFRDFNKLEFEQHEESNLFMMKKHEFRIKEVPDYYSLYFEREAHVNYAGMTCEQQPQYCIVSILESSKDGNRRALHTSIDGTEEFYISHQELPELRKEAVVRFLQNRFRDVVFTSLDVAPPEVVVPEVASIEKKFRQDYPRVKLGVVYCEKGENDLAKMFKNKTTSKSFDDFCAAMGVPSTFDPYHVYDTPMKWHNKDVFYFPAFAMKGSFIRQYIGNTGVLLIFYDSTEPFDASAFTLGQVTQCVVLVQPYPSKKYRISILNKTTLNISYLPELPENYLFDESVIKEFLLCKIHNAHFAMSKCPPTSHMFKVPRGAGIEDVAKKFLKGWCKKNTKTSS